MSLLRAGNGRGRTNFTTRMRIFKRDREPAKYTLHLFGGEILIVWGRTFEEACGTHGHNPKELMRQIHSWEFNDTPQKGRPSLE